MSEKLKKLTGKNPSDFQPVAYDIINTPDVDLFKELVDSDDYLFDFVKTNVAQRLEKECNAKNFLNILSFLKYYSPAYEDFIISVLTKFADEDLTDKMLEIFENGDDNEKIYCAKYFSVIKDPLALELLKKNAHSENQNLSSNCINSLAKFGDREIYNEAIEKLGSDDDFTQLEAIKILVSYGDKKAVDNIIQTAKKSTLSENIASELPYLENLFDILQRNKSDSLYIINLIIDGLGEITSLCQVFDFQLYDIFEYLINGNIDSKTSVVLLNAYEKFNTLTDNDEYLYDEPRDVKQEISDIKNLLSQVKRMNLSADKELDENSLFVFSALELTKNIEAIRELLNADNQTIVLKALETLKKYNALTIKDKNTALEAVSNENIINIIMAI